MSTREAAMPVDAAHRPRRRIRARAVAAGATVVLIGLGWLVVDSFARGAEGGRPAPGPVLGTAARPFSASSPWNTPIDAGVRYSSATSALTRSLTRHPERSWVNASSYSVGLSVAQRSDPVVPVAIPKHPDLRSRIPADARPAAGSDAELAVIDGTRSFEYWGAQRLGATWTARYSGVVSLTGPGTAGGVRASGFSLLGGLVRTGELHGIDHALVVALANDQLKPGPVAPAEREDSDAASSYRGLVPMGSHIAIPRSTDLTRLHLSPSGLVLARALQRYGAYVGDRSSALTLYAEPSTEGPALDAMRSDLRSTLAPLLRVVETTSS